MTEFLPDALILSVKMPYVDGIELCQVVRNDSYFDSLPVTFVIDEIQADISTRLLLSNT